MNDPVLSPECHRGAKGWCQCSGMNSRAVEITPTCPNCVKPLHHPRIVLRMGFRTLYSYYCDDCGEALTETAEAGAQRNVAGER